ncbi:copper homeostasis protein CutC [Vagococcus elongatus]|uniref:PF03932 family protein CutC n=1 Tax=Vagococcus elongatus TaxID=180344 RepID=A0A430AQ32_9ENTE|nr:copper homeostasis protein CutC [Vagococcus elongatus]RSU10007.1 copper homeostasis protein CutC [Vagococcus elongatus]
MIKEFCGENFSNIEKAIKNGAKRIELCDNMAVGGTTPSYGVIKETVKLGKQYDIPVMILIRPRGGNFVYSEAELKIMIADIGVAKQLGSAGIVIGCLNENGKLDKQSLELLIAAVGELEITFHMAFDILTKDEQLEAIDWLSEHGVKRILTHGGSSESDILDNFIWLSRLIDYAQDKLVIMPGGGITSKTVDFVFKNLMVDEVHSSKIVQI